MAAGKSDPFADFDRMRQRMEGLLHHLLRDTRLPSALGTEAHWTPAVDVYETADQYVILVELAGADRERIEVTLEGNRLKLTGDRREPLCPDIKKRLHQMEIDYGRFLRSVELPERPEAESVTARYDNGFLRITVAKRRPASPAPGDPDQG